MASDAQRNSKQLSGAGPYILRPLLQSVPLSADGGDEDVKINCVDFLGMRLRFTFIRSTR